MHLRTVKTAKDLPFRGIELVKTDTRITEVVVGGKLRIRLGQSYTNTLEVLVEAPHEAADRYRVTAKIDGFDPKVEHFENDYDAAQAVSRFEARGAEVEKARVSVLIDDAGEVVGDATTQPELVDDMPF